MPDAATMTGAPNEIELGGRTFKLSPLTVADLGELQAWVLAQLPDPIAVARQLAEGQPAEIAKEILLSAYEDTRNGARRLGSAEANAALKSLAGFRELLYLHGRKHHPEMTREAWEALLTAALRDEITVLSARLAEENGGAIPDPKAGAGAASSAPPTGPPTGGPTSPGSPTATAGGPTPSGG